MLPKILPYEQCIIRRWEKIRENPLWREDPPRLLIDYCPTCNNHSNGEWIDVKSIDRHVAKEILKSIRGDSPIWDKIRENPSWRSEFHRIVL